MSNEETTMGTGELIPTPGPSASLEELQRAYQQFESGDAPEYLKAQVLFDLAERIRDYGKDKEPPKAWGTGVLFSGADVEDVVKSGFKGTLRDDDGRPIKVKP